MIQPLETPADPHRTRLPFPTRPLRIGDEVVEEYVIPDDRRQEVLDQLYLFDPVPSLDEEVFDLHEGKTFVVRQFRVLWDRGSNWLVSPYYPSSGGTVIDWMPAEWADDEDDEEDQDDPDDEWEDDDGPTDVFGPDGDDDDLADIFGLDKDDDILGADDEADEPGR